jgi:hypothetical protein
MNSRVFQQIEPTERPVIDFALKQFYSRKDDGTEIN